MWINTNNLTAYGQKMINDSKILVKKDLWESFLSVFYNLGI